MRDVVVAGKGTLAIAATRRLLEHADRFSVVAAVPVSPEPDWDASFVQWAESKQVRVLGYHDLLTVELSSDSLLFSVFYDRIFSSAILERFQLKLNVHPAPLPKYRGVRPINWALRNREKIHGVTVHEMTPAPDAGPIWTQVTFPLFEDDGVASAYDRTMRYAVALVSDTIEHLDGIVPREQDLSKGSVHYASQNSSLGEWASW